LARISRTARKKKAQALIMAALEELDFEPEENDDMGSGAEVAAAAPAAYKTKVKFGDY